MAINYTVEIEEKLVVNGVEFEGASYEQLTEMICEIEAEIRRLSLMKAELYNFRSKNLLEGD